MKIRLLFNTSAIIEGLTGVALLVAPMFVIGLFLGNGLGPTGIAVARILGVGLMSFSIAVWEAADRDTDRKARIGMCMYNVGVAGLLVVFSLNNQIGGVLFWPVTALHGLIGIMMIWGLFNLNALDNNR